jgi:hypothetical protein
LIAKLIEVRRVQRCMQGCIEVNGSKFKKLSLVFQDARPFSPAIAAPPRTAAIDGSVLLAQAAA